MTLCGAARHCLVHRCPGSTGGSTGDPLWGYLVHRCVLTQQCVCVCAHHDRCTNIVYYSTFSILHATVYVISTCYQYSTVVDTPNTIQHVVYITLLIGMPLCVQKQTVTQCQPSLRTHITSARIRSLLSYLLYHILEYLCSGEFTLSQLYVHFDSLAMYCCIFWTGLVYLGAIRRSECAVVSL